MGLTPRAKQGHGTKTTIWLYTPSTDTRRDTRNTQHEWAVMMRCTSAHALIWYYCCHLYFWTQVESPPHRQGYFLYPLDSDLSLHDKF